VDEIVFQIEMSEESGFLVASWDAPEGGGITTQGKDLRELQEQVTDAIRCHFDPPDIPRKVRFHFIADPVLVDL
jgi:predicted RNase H-like HicB family nuclease